MVTMNADMGESLGIHSFGNDHLLLPLVDTINVACGFHSGDPSTMRQTIEAASEHGVTVGAHPGLPDLVGFGRREMKLDKSEVRDLVRYQVGALVAFLEAAGAALHHIKPHGALYGMLARDEDLMDAVCDVAIQYGVPVYGLPGTAHERAAARREVGFIAEFYADLNYGDDGIVVVERHGKQRSPDEFADRVRAAISEGSVMTATGNELQIRVDSVCIHSDLPAAPSNARITRDVINELSQGRVRSR
ncbi:LamB/YcsF family protein [Arthrobacter crystallopoietes BAB-32]|uniref:LamB/YcsF family protein n=1 Tax=Arthrobacter crystallopoietes BAB-32 TaxID=1246476 RepID=N1UZ18_9MICC|nr:5-oxoprolinase subunit PxpA [Arthrobacter crystallopoietes]EMY35646.1 LamB/YcsF family protein [Arthrobacter crystallopoietes BAB-32]